MACASTRAGAPAGTFLGFSRAADFYFTSEEPIKVIFEYTAMCAISITDRTLFTINASPNAAAVFPDELTQPITGANFASVPGNTPVYYYDQVLAFHDDQKIPLFIESFPAPNQARTNAGIIGGFVGTSFNNNTTGIYKVKFVRVALDPSSLGTYSGGAQKTTVKKNGKCKERASMIIKACFLPLNPTLTVNPALPVDTYLRMQKQTKDGKWVDYIPPNAIKTGEVDAQGFVEYVLTDLDPETKYTAYVADITVRSTDSATTRRNKTVLKQLYLNNPIASLYNNIYWWNVNRIDQPTRLATFWTPFEKGSKRTLKFITGSCYAGTLDALQNATTDVEYHFQFKNGDTYYQDNARTPDPNAVPPVPDTDFIEHYKGLLYVKSEREILQATGLYAIPDDHEISDNASTNSVFFPGNQSEFLLQGAEAVLYNAMFNTPNTVTSPNAQYNVFPASNQFTYNPLPNTRFIAAYKAFDQFWPARPIDADSNKNFAVNWGETDIIGTWSQAAILDDLSVRYWARPSIVKPDGTIVFLNEPNQYIPNPALYFIKEALANSKATVKIVFFSKDLHLVWKKHYDQIKQRFFQIARSTDPTASNTLIETIYNKAFRSYNADSPDGYADQINGLFNWIKEKKIENVIFFTGDPHVSYLRYVDRKLNMINCCTSAVSSYRASGYPLMLQSNIDQDDTIMNISLNTYAGVEVDVENMQLTIIGNYADEIRGKAVLPLIPVCHEKERIQCPVGCVEYKQCHDGEKDHKGYKPCSPCNKKESVSTEHSVEKSHKKTNKPCNTCHKQEDTLSDFSSLSLEKSYVKRSECSEESDYSSLE